MAAERTTYYHADEVAKILGLDVSEVRTMLANGELIGHKHGRRWLINKNQPCFIDKPKDEYSESAAFTYVKDTDHEKIISKQLSSVKKSLFIATANFKNVHVGGSTLISVLNKMVKKGIDVKVICSRLQSNEEAKFNLVECPRNHMKMFVFDCETLYLGSANLTPAALEDRRTKSRRTNNHEAGILTTDKTIIEQAIAHFNESFQSDDCKTCKIKDCKLRN